MRRAELNRLDNEDCGEEEEEEDEMTDESDEEEVRGCFCFCLPFWSDRIALYVVLTSSPIGSFSAERRRLTGRWWQ